MSRERTVYYVYSPSARLGSGMVKVAKLFITTYVFAMIPILIFSISSALIASIINLPITLICGIFASFGFEIANSIAQITFGIAYFIAIFIAIYPTYKLTKRAYAKLRERFEGFFD